MSDEKKLMSISFKIPEGKSIIPGTEEPRVVTEGVKVLIDGEERFEIDGTSLADLIDHFFEARGRLEDGRKEVIENLEKSRDDDMADLSIDPEMAEKMLEGWEAEWKKGPSARAKMLYELIQRMQKLEKDLKLTIAENAIVLLKAWMAESKKADEEERI